MSSTPRAFLALLIAAAACGGGAPEAEATHRAGESIARQTTCPLPLTDDPSRVRVQRDVAYAARGGDSLRMDVARPPAPGPHPVVLLLHGGGWEGGSRRSMRDAAVFLAASGYVAATASYRLTAAPRDVFPAAAHDARCAVRWLRANAGSIDADPGRVGVFGYSAGAHLASLLGTASDVPELLRPPDDAADAGCLAPPAATTDARVQAVISFAGPQDLRVNGAYTQEQARLVTNFLGAFPGDVPELARLASPIVHVSEGDAPFLLVHGTRDELVPVAHARRMRDALRAAGVPATLLELNGVGHGLPPLNAREIPEVGCTTFAFLDRWLRPDAPTPGREP